MAKRRATGRKSNKDDGGENHDHRPSPSKKKRPNPKTIVLSPPKKSPSDPKSYRMIRLENGLTACLMHSPDANRIPGWSFSKYYSSKLKCGVSPVDIPSFADSGIGDTHFYVPENTTEAAQGNGCQLAEAAICLAIRAGSANDPPDNLGLAHLVEHMTFQGSRKYPQESHFQRFIAYHGSTHNAYTQPEKTVYYCALDPAYLDTAMDVLSQMILEPLFTEDCAQREVHAVDNEFLLKRPSEWVQAMEVIKLTTSKNHPIGNYSWGDLSTIQRTKMHRNLSAYHNANYFPANMALAVQSTAPLDEIQSIVEKYWGETSEKNAESINETNLSRHLTNPYDTDQFRKLYKIPAPYDSLLILWSFEPATWKDFKMKPLDFLKFIFADTKEGSLHTTYVERKWASSIEASEAAPYCWHSNFSSLFAIQINLLEDGINNIDQVVQCLYDFIGVILHEEALPQKKRLWAEMKHIRNEMFNFKGSGNALSNAQDVAINLLSFPNSMEDMYTRELVTEEYSDETFSKCMYEKFQPQDALYIQFVHHAKLGSNQKKLAHCETIYSVEEIPSSFSDEVIFPELGFDKINQFIPTDFVIQPFVPHRPIVNNQKFLLEHKMVRGLNLPRASWQFRIASKVKPSVIGQHFMNIWARYIEMILNSTITSANTAGVEVGVVAYGMSFVISLIGFPQHMTQLLGLICSQFFLDGELSEHHFNISKQMELVYYKAKLNNNLAVFRATVSRLLFLDSNNVIDTPCRLHTINKLQLENFIKEFRERLAIMGHFGGNTSEEQARKSAKVLTQYENHFNPITQDLESNTKEIILYSQERCLRIFNVENQNTNNNNNIIRNFYHLARQSKENMLNCKIVSALMAPCAFQQLRTEKQLGYSVSNFGPFPGSQRPTLAVQIISPSSKFSACEVSTHIDSFMVSFYAEYLKKIGEEEFTHFMTNFLKCYVQTNTKPVTLSELKTWYKTSVLDCFPNKNRKSFYGISKLSVQLLGNHQEECSENLHCLIFDWKQLENGNPAVEFAAPMDVCMGESKELSGEKYFIWDIKEFQDKVDFI